MLAFWERLHVLTIDKINIYAIDDHRFDDENRCFGDRKRSFDINHFVSDRRQPGVVNAGNAI